MKRANRGRPVSPSFIPCLSLADGALAAGRHGEAGDRIGVLAYTGPVSSRTAVPWSPPGLAAGAGGET